MPLVGLRLGSVRDYHCKPFDDSFELKGEEFIQKEGTTPVVFKLGTLSSRLLAHLRDEATSFVPDPSNPETVVAKFLPNHSSFETVRFGLKGWENFRDVDGGDIPFKTVKRSIAGVTVDAVSDDTMDQLPLDVIRDLSNAIVEGNQLSEEAAKNSDE